MMKAYEVRMANELYELESRLSKLNAFISEIDDGNDMPMSDEEYAELKEQQKAMTDYRDVLKRRCERHGIKGGGWYAEEETIRTTS